MCKIQSIVHTFKVYLEGVFLVSNYLAICYLKSITIVLLKI